VTNMLHIVSNQSSLVSTSTSDIILYYVKYENMQYRKYILIVCNNKSFITNNKYNTINSTL